MTSLPGSRPRLLGGSSRPLFCFAKAKAPFPLASKCELWKHSFDKFSSCVTPVLIVQSRTTSKVVLWICTRLISSVISQKLEFEEDSSNSTFEVVQVTSFPFMHKCLLVKCYLLLHRRPRVTRLDGVEDTFRWAWFVIDSSESRVEKPILLKLFITRWTQVVEGWECVWGRRCGLVIRLPDSCHPALSPLLSYLPFVSYWGVLMRFGSDPVMDRGKGDLWD